MKCRLVVIRQSESVLRQSEAEGGEAVVMTGIASGGGSVWCPHNKEFLEVVVPNMEKLFGGHVEIEEVKTRRARADWKKM